jgi:hypothetical protein
MMADAGIDRILPTEVISPIQSYVEPPMGPRQHQPGRAPVRQSAPRVSTPEHAFRTEATRMSGRYC